jgi:hypothetical protein
LSKSGLEGEGREVERKKGESEGERVNGIIRD